MGDKPGWVVWTQEYQYFVHCCVDDDNTFTAIHKDKIDTDIQFTKDIEDNGKLPFLDFLISQDNNKLLYKRQCTENWCIPTAYRVILQPNFTEDISRLYKTI